MLDGLVGQVFKVVSLNDVVTSRFMITAVNGSMASIVNGENHASTVSVWSVMSGLQAAMILPEAPAPPSDGLSARSMDASIPADTRRPVVQRAPATVTVGPAVRPGESRDLDALFHTLQRQLGEILPVPIVVVSVDLGQQRWLLAHVHVREPADATVWHRSSLLQEVASTRRPLIVQDTATIPDGGLSQPVPAGVRGFVAIPLLTSTGLCIGVLSLLDVQPFALEAHDLDRIIDVGQSFADRAGVMLAATMRHGICAATVGSAARALSHQGHVAAARQSQLDGERYHATVRRKPSSREIRGV
jgi:hypothetical protein